MLCVIIVGAISKMATIVIQQQRLLH